MEFELTFLPYDWRTTASTVTSTVNTVYGQPSYSCIDPDGVEPSGPSAVASYLNMKFAPAFHKHTRKM